MAIKRIGGDAAGSGFGFNRKLVESALAGDAIGVAQSIAFSVGDGIARIEALSGVRDWANSRELFVDSDDHQTDFCQLPGIQFPIRTRYNLPKSNPRFSEKF